MKPIQHCREDLARGSAMKLDSVTPTQNQN